MTARNALLSAGLIASLTTSAWATKNFSLENSPNSSTMQETEQYGLLQSEMRDRGMGGDMLDRYGLKLNGYVAAGVSWNNQHPFQGFNGIGRLFDDKEQDPRLDQLSLQLSREALVSPDRFDTGFNVQVIYGADARYTQANGTNFYGDGYNNKQVPLAPTAENPNPNPHLLLITPGQEFPENEIDIFQAYLTMNIPWQKGLLLTLGKFETPWGVERVEPGKNSFYSHGYIFGLSHPMTLTGLSGEMQWDDQWAFKAGIVTGWDQSIKDDNDMPSFFVQASYELSSEWSFVLSYMTGPEKPDNRSDWRQLIDLTAEWKIAPEWTVNLEAVLGYENDVSTKFTLYNAQDQRLDFPQRVFTFDDGIWFGAAAWSSYKLDERGQYTLVFRGEYFNDNQGERQLITEVYSGAVGLNWVPFIDDRVGKHLMIRPELRTDWATEHIFDADEHDTQLTFSIDAIFSF